MQKNSNNLLVVVELFWANKIKLLIVTLVSTALAIALALYLPNQYQAVVVVAPAEDSSGAKTAMSGLSDSLASMAGVSISSETVSKIDIVLETLQSKNFILDFVDRHKIKIPLMAGYRWNEANDVLELDADIYNSETEKWTFRSFGVPPQEFVYDEFMSHLTVLTDVQTGIIKITFQSPSPILAQKWVMWLIEDINESQRIKDIEKSDLSIQYLQTQIEQTNIVEVRNVFFDLIREQHSKRLLANTRDEYALTVIDPALVPDIKASPKRALIVIIGMFLGFFCGFLLIYARHLYLESKQHMS